jgi:tetratricopeptide (TPR) repeat protein
MRHAATILALALVLAAVAVDEPACAEDTVVLAPRADAPGRIVVKGTVVEYLSTGLVLEASGGTKQTIPARQVVEVRSTWTADHTAADDLWRKRDYLAAAARYQSALTSETRPWARRFVRARLVAALREAERWEFAAEQFFTLLREDPGTPYFDVLPLAWTTITPTPTLEAKARTWSADRNSSIGALVGSSYLLSSADRSEALRRLKELALDADARIALLSEAQLWRIAAGTADAGQLAGWERTIEKLPDPLRPGPYLTYGRALGRSGQADRAALALLRVSILYPDQHRLSAEALWSAGQMLENASQPREAAGLYRELVREYPQTLVAASAKDRLNELKTE